MALLLWHPGFLRLVYASPGAVNLRVSLRLQGGVPTHFALNVALLWLNHTQLIEGVGGSLREASLKALVGL
jgi:hypothetical protein